MKNNIDNMYQESHRNMDDSNCLEEIWQAVLELKRMIEVIEKKIK